VADNPGTDVGESSTEPKPEQTRRITLGHAEQTVTVEAPDDLQTIAGLAAYFWLLTTPPEKAELGFSAGSTLFTERADPPAPAGGDEQVTGCR
jgi:hypothetical protein